MVIRKIFEIFLLVVITEGCCLVTDYPDIEDISVYADLGGNVTFPCKERKDNEEDFESFDPGSVMWIHKGKEEEQIARLKILSDGSLSLENVDRADAGEYRCTLEKEGSESDKIPGKYVDDDDVVLNRKRLFINTPPSALVNVSVHPTAVLALLLWEIGDNGGYEISHFSAQYRLKYGDPKEGWHDVLPKFISASARHIDVYRLSPNSTYVFRIWASNQLGDGEITEIEGTTTHDSQEIELARHLLQGAENFDTRVWVVAVAVVMGTLVVLSVGTCYLLCKEYNMPALSGDDQEIIELVPNIILNPGFYDADLQAERFYQLDENCNDQTPIRVNNNSVIQPIRL